MQDLKNDYFQDQIKSFLKSKFFLIFACFMLGFFLYYLNVRSQQTIESKMVSQMISNDNYKKAKIIAVKNRKKYELLKFILLSKSLLTHLDLSQEEFNSFLTDIKNDENFGVLMQILVDFKNKNRLDKFRSIDSPWIELAYELDVVNLHASPDNFNLLPILVGNKVSIQNPLSKKKLIG